MRKPSAALVVATAALVMAAIGTSVAASGYTITSSKQIKPGSIALSSLSKSARRRCAGRAARRRPGRGWLRRQRRGGRQRRRGRRSDGRTRRRVWAQVKARRHHQRRRARGVTARERASTGIYYVNFGQRHHALRRRRDAGLDPRFRQRPGHSTTGIPGPAFVVQNSAGGTLATGFPNVSSGARCQTRRVTGAAVATSFTIAALC